MSESKRLLKVFLCHASADKPKVRELYRYLRRRGVQPWFDEINLIGGQDWQVEIPKALATSDAIIICLTKNSVDKEGYIQKEIKFALDKALEMPEGRIFLIPVKFEECDLPYSLSRFQWVDLFSSEAGYSKMMKALKFRAEQLDLSPTVELSKKAIEDEIRAIKDAAREKSEREAAEKFKRDQAEYDAAEQLARAKAGHESAEKARRENELSYTLQEKTRKFQPMTVLFLGIVGMVATLVCLLGFVLAGSMLPQYFSPKTTTPTVPTAALATATLDPAPVLNIESTFTPFPLTSDMITGKVQIACGGDVSFVDPSAVNEANINLYTEERVDGISKAGSLYLILPLMYTREISMGSNAVQASFISDRMILDSNVLLSTNGADSRCIFYWETSTGYIGGETTYVLASNQNTGTSFLYWIELPVDNKTAERAQFFHEVAPTAKPAHNNDPQQSTKIPDPTATP